VDAEVPICREAGSPPAVVLAEHSVAATSSYRRFRILPDEVAGVAMYARAPAYWGVWLPSFRDAWAEIMGEAYQGRRL
jgi:hypothetical protein